MNQSQGQRRLQSVLITGGMGFIGTNFIRFLLGEESGFDGSIINLDALTYAANPENLQDVTERYSDRYTFVHGSVTDGDLMDRLFDQYEIDTVVHFAAESHVDRSIAGPRAFIDTNVMGTFTLLEVARHRWGSDAAGQGFLFHHISTDEVYGSLGETGYFTESTAYDPRSPYSASKAAADHLVSSYYHTYRLPVTITNCSNNYGPYQFPEKLIPLMILNIVDEKPLPVYGDGRNIRDWLYVDDHNQAVWTVMQSGHLGQSYNVGGENEWENIQLVETLCDLVADELSRPRDTTRRLITFVKDRPGHDRRYAVDCARIKNDLGWQQTVGFKEGLRRTVRWYLDNPVWIDHVRSGEYQEWMHSNYGDR